jgi:hypothetical protein
MGDYQTVANMGFYTTGDAVANTLTSYLTSSGATNLYQLKGNYLTDASLFQNAGNYLTSTSPIKWYILKHYRCW